MLPLRRTVKRLSGLFILLLILSASALASETPWGRAPVYGYKDTIRSESRKFAPYAVSIEKSHVEGLHLEYAYQRFSLNEKVWQLRMVDDDGKPVTHHGNLRIVLPYPSIWSKEYGMYWKWTKRYAERYDWEYAKGWAYFAYAQSETAFAFAGIFYGDEYRPVRKMRDYGVEIPFINDFTEIAVLVRFDDPGCGPSGWANSWFDDREEYEKKKKPFDDLDFR